MDRSRAGLPDLRGHGGGALRNVYRQTLIPGLVTVGDAVATTTPARGRGVAMACMQIEALLQLLDGGADPLTVAQPFDAWCETIIEPWVAAHVDIDGGTVKRWRGQERDFSGPLTSNLIADAVQVEPLIGPYRTDRSDGVSRDGGIRTRDLLLPKQAR